MPKAGEFDLTYPNKLKEIGVILLEDFKGSKKHHKLKCCNCNHEWTTTPVFIIQTNKNYKTNGCPACNTTKRNTRKQTIRIKNLQILTDRGFEILSNYNGQVTTDNQIVSTPIMVTVKNTQCGHVFTSSSKNLLTRNVTCPVCNKEVKTKRLNDSSHNRSVEWQKTATEWGRYKHQVYMATRRTYNKHKNIINPNNLPRNKAGVKDAYHLDHIVPIRYCFDHNVPIDKCTHPDNLRLIGWRENVGSRDKLKTNVPIPNIFMEYIKTT